MIFRLYSLSNQGFTVKFEYSLFFCTILVYCTVLAIKVLMYSLRIQCFTVHFEQSRFY